MSDARLTTVPKERRVDTDSGIGKRLRAWRMFSGLAVREGRADSFLLALAFGWTLESCGLRGSTFSFGGRGLVRAWIGNLRQRRARSVSAKAAAPGNHPGRFDILVIPQFASTHYSAPCFALARVLQNAGSSVAILKPEGIAVSDFAPQARQAECECALITTEWIVPFMPIAAAASACCRFLNLLVIQEPAAFKTFMRGKPLWTRFLQVLSNQLAYGQIKRQLQLWKIQKIVTMSEQWFPANLFVAAANDLGIETHQILHGGMATDFCVPFQSRYLWPEYEVSARQVVRLGVDPSRLKLVPGFQVAAQLSAYKPQTASTKRESGKRRVLVLAQYHGYSLYGQACFRDALVPIFEAVSRRQGTWDLAIRPHPCDGDGDLKEMRRMMREPGISGIFTDRNGSLAEQAAKASLVATATSSGLFIAIAVGTPACLVWGPEQAQAHASPFLDPEWVAYTTDDVIGILDRVAATGGKGGVSLAAEQASSLGLSDWQSAPKRVCEELLLQR